MTQLDQFDDIDIPTKSTPKPSKPKTTSKKAQKEVEEEQYEDTRSRPKRKVTYTAVSLTEVPEEISAAFTKDNWKLRFIRYHINGTVDERNLARRSQEGWEYVTSKDLIDMGFAWYLTNFQTEDTRHFKDLLLSGDSVLAKADLELIESRKKYFENKTNAELQAADIHTISRKRGYVDLGTKSSTTHAEPNFRN